MVLSPATIQCTFWSYNCDSDARRTIKYGSASVLVIRPDCTIVWSRLMRDIQAALCYKAQSALGRPN